MHALLYAPPMPAKSLGEGYMLTGVGSGSRSVADMMCGFLLSGNVVSTSLCSGPFGDGGETAVGSSMGKYGIFSDSGWLLDALESGSNSFLDGAGMSASVFFCTMGFS